jgi:hypothetical protein
MSDPRKGYPSASAMQQLALCPGSHALETSLDLPESPGPYATMGTAIATYLEAVRSKRVGVPILARAEHEIAQACMKGVDIAKEKIAAEVGDFFESKLTLWAAEVRLWGLTSRTGRGFSGRFDLAAFNKSADIAVIFDDKSGWGDVPPAATNLQLRTLAVLAWKTWLINNIYVVLNQPAKGEPSIAKYDKLALIAATAEIESYIDAAYTPGADRRPTPLGCKFCTAKSVCPQAMEVLTKMANGELSGDWSTVLEQCEVAQLVIDDLRAKAKGVLANDPNAIPGWELKPGATRSTVTDSKAAFGYVSDIVSSDDFMGCCSVRIGDLAKVYQSKGSFKNLKAARSALQTRLDSVITRKQSEPSLQRIGADSNKEEA